MTNNKRNYSNPISDKFKINTEREISKASHEYPEKQGLIDCKLYK